MTRNQILYSAVMLFVFLIFQQRLGAQHDKFEDWQHDYQAKSLLGRKLKSPKPSTELLEKLKHHQARYLEKPDDPDRLIWYGRFVAYGGDYRKAISIYTQGIKKFPTDPRMYRHRGHRLITIREFEKAIADFEKAITLIKGKKDQVEPDGMPNARNIPVSSLHTNIYYHLGLAYFLTNQFDKAVHAYEAGLKACQNDDMRVAFIHWTFMANRQLENKEAAEKVLEPIARKMNVIESFDYHKLGLMYKGLASLEDIREMKTEKSKGSSEALLFGIANWHLQNGDRDQAKAVLRELMGSKSWGAFGVIAAEATWLREFEKPKQENRKSR